MSDPLSDIENKQGQHDVGVIAFRIFTGAREEGATRYEAYLLVLAWFRAALTQQEPND